MESYDAAYLGDAMRLLGRAFDFADEHLPDGMVFFFTRFALSREAEGFDAPGSRPQLRASGIELVLAVCGKEARTALDAALPSVRRKERGWRERARWCGQAIGYHQWKSGLSFRTISSRIAVHDLVRTYDENPGITPMEAEPLLAEAARRAQVPTRLGTLRRAAGLTQRELAAVSGAGLRSIQQYEQRKKDVNRANAITVYRLAQALSCRIEDILEL